MKNFPKRRIYLLDDQKMSQETIAVAFAKTSRSPESFDVIAAELDETRSAEFNEKWVVGYSHSSVAEHAVLHLAVENVSRLVTENIQSNRLASFTEKSTRYQKIDKNNYYVPHELVTNSELMNRYINTCDELFRVYAFAMEKLDLYMQQNTPKFPDETEKCWLARCHAHVVDSVRFLLPAATLANVGITINARSLEYAISKLLNDPLDEGQVIGREIKKVALQSLPILVKYANRDESLISIQNCIRDYVGSKIATTNNHQGTRLLRFDPEGENLVLASLLFRYGSSTRDAYLAHVHDLKEEEKARLFEFFFSQRDLHTRLMREFEYSAYQFEIVVDQGAYYELKRHRIMTQTPQMLSTNLGFTTPPLFEQAGLDQEFIQAMTMAKETYQLLAEENPFVASYVVPNACKRRVLVQLDFREASELIRLRTSPKAHFTIRKMANDMYKAIEAVHPNIAKLIQATPVDD